MPVFDAVCLAFGTAGTGGFGVLNDSVASYNPYCQWVITVFMLLFAVNFNVYFLLLTKNFKGASESSEPRTYLGIVAFAVVFITANTVIVIGDVPSVSHIPERCSFHTRCPYAAEECKKAVPALKDLGDGHFSACLYAERLLDN